MRQPPAERIRFILILELLGLLHAWLGEWLRTLALRLAGEGSVGRASCASPEQAKSYFGRGKCRHEVNS